MSVKKLVILAVGVVFLALLVFFSPLRFFDNIFYDLNFAISGRSAVDSVVVIGIDSKAVSEHGAMPWPRSVMAGLVDAINSCEPRAIAMDFLFIPRDDSLGNDSLERVFSRTKNLVLPFRAEEITNKLQSSAPAIPKGVFDQRFLRLSNTGKLNQSFFYSVLRFSEADPRFSRYAARGGFLNVSTSNTSQKLREVIHVVRAGEEFFPSFGLAAVAQYLEVKPEDLVLDGKPQVIVGAKKIALTSYAATSFINFRTGPKPIKTYSAADVLSPSFDRNRLRGKLVFVGVTDPMVPADFFLTPARPQFPGVEVWATSALDILEDSAVSWGGGVWGVFSWLLILLLFPGLALLVPGSKKQLAVFGGVGIVALSVVLSIVLFRNLNYFWDPANHLYAWIFSLLWLAAIKADPSLVQMEALDLDIPQQDTEDTLNPPQEKDFITEVPACPTAAFVLKKVAKMDAGATGPNEETVLGTIIEKVSSGTPAPLTSAFAPEDLRTVKIPQEALADFRSVCGGSIIKMLGSGGMADVYLEWNPRLEVYRAVKVLKPGMPSTYLSRFKTEIRIFSKLNHPNIVHCYGVGEWHTLPCVEMEFVSGSALEAVLEKCQSFTAAQTAAIGILVCRALSYAHSQVFAIYGQNYNGVVHRDLKPANILISKSGRIKLTDFGIARPGAVSLHTMDSGSVVGTLPYLAPEQLDSTTITAQADIYALGATLYEFLTGARAFPQTEMTALLRAKSNGEFKPIQPSATVPKALADCISKAMSTAPAARFESAQAMGKELETILKSLTKDKAYLCLKDLVKSYWG
jgi:CHASE2 domain-containing sensor protein